MFSISKRQNVRTLAGLVLLTALFCTSNLLAQSPEGTGGLVGNWWVTVTITNCITTQPTKMKFPSMLLFARGGTLTESTFNPGFLPGQRGTGFGVWSLNDDGTYSARDTAFILFSGNGFTAGTQVITHTITLTGPDSWKDTAHIHFYDIAGNALMNGCASASAKRM